MFVLHIKCLLGLVISKTEAWDSELCQATGRNSSKMKKILNPRLFPASFNKKAHPCGWFCDSATK